MSQHPSLQDKYNIPAIRNLLTAAFDDEELVSFCFDHFHVVYKNFTSGMTFQSKVQLLIDHCDRNNSLDKLLSWVENLNPNKYAELGPYVMGAPPQPVITTLDTTQRKSGRFILYTILSITTISIIISAIWFTLPDPVCSKSFKVNEFGIITADFGEGPDLVESKRGRVITEVLHRNFLTKIQEAGLSNVQVIRLGSIIRNENEAKNIGAQCQASIVVWGWVSPEEDIFFPNFTPTARLSELTAAVVEKGELQVYLAPLAQLETTDLGISLSNRTTIYAIFAIGLAFMSEHDYEAAIHEFNKAIELHDQKSGVEVLYNYRGKAYLSQHLLDEALVSFKRAIDINPNYASAYIGLGNVHYHKEDWESATKLYEEALDHDKNCYLAIFGLGNVNYMQGNFSEAASFYEKITKVKDDYALSHFYLALTYYALKDYNRSIKAFQETVHQADNEGNELLKEAALNNLDIIIALTETTTQISPVIHSQIYQDNLLPSPVLVEPPSYWTLIGTFVYLSWKWERELTPNEYFEIKLRMGETEDVIFSDRTKIPHYTLNIAEVIRQEFENRVYFWSVQVISVREANRDVSDNFVSYESELRAISHVNVATKLCICY